MHAGVDQQLVWNSATWSSCVHHSHEDMSAAFHCMAVHSLSRPLLACRYSMQLFSAAPDICAQY
jgi:hypothetical protein